MTEDAAAGTTVAPSHIAHICHEANRVFCAIVMADYSQLDFSVAPEWQVESATKGVQGIIDGTITKPSDSHESWMREKLEAGWVYGDEKNPDASPPTHPCIVEYDQLPAMQRRKDHLFLAIVRALTEPLD